MPLLSVVIPTLARPDTLRCAMTTLAQQSGDDCEFIIQNNGGDRDIADLVAAMGDARFRHFATPQIVTMTDNWEHGLANASGRYVTFVGDDDGLMPDACAIAASMLRHNDPELLSWSPYAYFWPMYHHPGHRNRLVAAVDYQFGADRVTSRDELTRFYRYQVHYSRLPMIYNSFVRRDVIERAKARLGRYFLGSSPDVTSGIVNAAVSDSFVRLSRPLSISGLSQHSTGHAFFFAETDAFKTERARRDFGDIPRDPRLPSLNGLHLFVANDMLEVKSKLFPDDAQLALNFRGLTQAVATEINDRPEIYDQTLKTVHSLADLHGFDPADIVIPPRLAERPALDVGVTPQGPHRVLFQLDGAAMGLQSIADAVRVMAQLVPGRAALDLRVQPDREAVPVLGPEGLDFNRDGRGVSALIEGWSEPEDWGTWSVAKSCSLRLRLDAKPAKPLQLEITCRAFVHRTPVTVSCQAGATKPQNWSFSPLSRRGSRLLRLDPAAIAPDGEVVLTFMLSEPRSPADLGLSPDVRPLGVGIERIRLAG